MNVLFVTLSPRCSTTSDYQGQLLSFEIDSSTSQVYTHSFSPASALNNNDWSFGGGSIAGSGGVSINSAYGLPVIYLGTERTVSTSTSSFRSTGESVVALDLALNMRHTYSPSSEMGYDFTTTPVIMTPSTGCPRTLLAAVDTAGDLFVLTADLSSMIQKVTLSTSTYSGYSVSAPAFDSSRDILYVSTPDSAVLAYKLNSYCVLTLEWRVYLQSDHDQGSYEYVMTGGADFSDHHSSRDSGSESEGLAQWSSPTIAGDLVYLARYGGSVFGLNADTGGLLWKSQDSYGQMFAGPTVVDGRVFVVDTGSQGVGTSIWAYEMRTRASRNQVYFTTDAEQRSGFRYTQGGQDTQGEMSEMEQLNAEQYYFSYAVEDDTFSPSLGDDFTITVGGRVLDLRTIASIGNVPKNGVVSPDYIQRVFQFTGDDSVGDNYRFFFRIPIAGKPSSTMGMRNIGVNWFSPSTTDVWQSDNEGIIQYYIGSYDASSLKLKDGGLEIKYRKGQYCPVGQGYDRSFTANFQCGETANYTYTYFEKPKCIHYVNISSSTFCDILRAPSPTAEPTVEPTAEPTAEPTVEPTHIPTAEPTAEPTAQPTAEPTSEPTVEPSTASPTREDSDRPTPFPSVHPSSLPSPRPSYRPTPRPSAEPSYPGPTFARTALPTRPSLSPVDSPTLEPAAMVSPGPTSDSGTNQGGNDLGLGCIQLALVDSFGDGWGNARLMVMPSIGEPFAVSPSCAGDVVLSQYCFSPDVHEDGDFVVVSIVGFQPKNFWEIFWQVLDIGSGSVYSGSYTTSMTFVYRMKTTRFFTVGSVTMMNELPEEIECHTCEEHDVQEKDSGFLSDMLYSGMSMGGRQRGNDDMQRHPRRRDEEEETMLLSHKRAVGSLFDRAKKDKKSVGEKPGKEVEIGKGNIGGQISFTIYGEVNAWDYSDGYGTSFYIYDRDGLHLYYSGNLCGDEDDGRGARQDSCGVALKEGDYMWRVAAGGSEDLIWSFCGVRADSKTELEFRWGGNQCNPIRTKTISQMCKTQQVSQSLSVSPTNEEQTDESAESVSAEMSSRLQTQADFTVAGSIRLGSMSTHMLTENDQAILQQAIASELSDSIPLMTVWPKQVSIESIQMSGTDLLIIFHVSVIAEQFGVSVDLASQDSLDELALDLRSYLQRAMTSGLFLARVRGLIGTGQSDLQMTGEMEVTQLYADHRGQKVRPDSSWTGWSEGVLYHISHSPHILISFLSIGLVMSLFFASIWIPRRYSRSDPYQRSDIQMRPYEDTAAAGDSTPSSSSSQSFFSFSPSTPTTPGSEISSFSSLSFGYSPVSAVEDMAVSLHDRMSAFSVNMGMSRSMEVQGV